MALPGPLVRPWRLIRRWLPPCNFITIHYAYFIVTCLISAVSFWGASTPFGSVRFVDALFLVVSAMTLSGLGTINLSVINTFQQVILFLLIMMGSAIFVSGFVVYIRKRAFEKKFQIVVEKERQKDGRRRRTLSLHRNSEHELGEVRRTTVRTGRSSSRTGDENINHPVATSTDDFNSRKGTGKRSSCFESAIADDDEEPTTHPTHLTFSRDTRFRPGSASQHSYRRRSRLSMGMQGVGARPGASLDITTTDVVRPTSSGAHSERSAVDDRLDPNRYLEDSEGWISRNSQFHGLTERERERLGGYEYRAVALLAWLVPAYSIVFQLLGCLGCAAWVALNRPDTARNNGLNPWWLGAFNAVSAFSELITSMNPACLLICNR